MTRCEQGVESGKLGASFAEGASSLMLQTRSKYRTPQAAAFPVAFLTIKQPLECVPLTSNPNCDADKAGDAMAMKMNRASIMQSGRGTVQAFIFRADFYFEVQPPPPPPPPLRQVLRMRVK
jgi:hypothetical protein